MTVHFELKCPLGLHLDISCRVTRGAPGRGPSYSDGGIPPDPDEVEIKKALLMSGVMCVMDITDKLIASLSDDGRWALEEEAIAAADMDEARR